MKYIICLPLLAVLTSIVRADDDLETLENSRAQAICKAVDQINSEFVSKYKFLLQRANLKGDTTTSLSIQTLIADLETPQSIKDAKSALIAQPWIFTAPKSGYMSNRVFKSDGSWNSSDESQKGSWVIKQQRLLITLNGRTEPEVFRFPLKKERWKGTGSVGDEIVLNAAKAATQ